MNLPRPYRTRAASRRAATSQALLTAAVAAALAAAIPAQLQFDELPRRGLPAANDRTRSVTLGDVDGDGDLDLLCSNSPTGSPAGGQNLLCLNDGTGAFTDVTATHLPADNELTQHIALGDVDGDGDLDLVCANYGQSRLYLNNGGGVFADVTSARLPVGSWGRQALLADVDGDHDLDLVLVHMWDWNQLYLNDGTGTFTDVTATQFHHVGSATYEAALVDVDGDHDLDLVCANWQRNQLYLNDGTGAFAEAPAGRLPSDADVSEAVAVGDVDADGDVDVVIGNTYYPTGSAQDRLYLNDGTGAFTDATATHLPVLADGTSAVALVDVDGDGDLDLLLGGRLRVLLNDGNGRFEDVSAQRLALVYANALTTGDLDRDGDIDAALTIYNQPERILWNLQRQLDAPDPLRIGQDYQLDAYLRYGPPGPIDFALPYVSFAAAAIVMPPFGAIGIDPALAIALPAIPIPKATGVGTLTVAIPGDPGLLGLTLYTQLLSVPYPYQAHLGNVVHDVVDQN